MEYVRLLRDFHSDILRIGGNGGGSSFSANLLRNYRLRADGKVKNRPWEVLQDRLGVLSKWILCCAAKLTKCKATVNIYCRLQASALAWIGHTIGAKKARISSS